MTAMIKSAFRCMTIALLLVIITGCGGSSSGNSEDISIPAVPGNTENTTDNSTPDTDTDGETDDDEADTGTETDTETVQSEVYEGYTLYAQLNSSAVCLIDHSTTTEEAAGHSGGNSGMGGDLLYRWGNPQTYGGGTADDQRLFAQHDAEWIETGCPGAGNILIFNNGGRRPEGNYSSIEEIVPPLNDDGTYDFNEDWTYGPDEALWDYIADLPADFYAQNIFYPHPTIGLSHLSGDTVMVPGDEQKVSHRWQVWQSSGNIMAALPVSSSIRMTSMGQLITHSPHPMHVSVSMLAMVMVFPPCSPTLGEVEDCRLKCWNYIFHFSSWLPFRFFSKLLPLPGS